MFFYNEGESEVSYTLPVEPSIVTEGLQLHLDAGDTNSYPGTGTTWYDLSGNGRNAILNNGVAYNSSTGYLDLDGVDDYISLPTDLAMSELTVDMWFQLNDFTDGSLWILENANDPELRLLVNTNGTINLRAYDNGIYFVDANAATSTSLSLDKWYNLVLTIKNNDVKLYLNSQLEIDYATAPYNGGSGIGEHTLGTFNNGPYTGYSGYRNSNYAVFRYYDRVLSEAEVLQNFNATKTRFGL